MPNLIRSSLFLASLALAGCALFDKSDPSPAVDGGLGQPCVGAAECATGFICAGGICALEGPVGLGGACWANRDCRSDLFCTPVGVCGPAGTGDVGDPCGTGAECRRELACELFGFGGTCVPSGSGDLGDACAALGDCLAGLVCAADGTCRPPAVAYPPFEGVECVDDEGPFRVFFEVPRPSDPPADFYRLPFPSDVRVDADGALDMSDFPRPGPTFIGVDLVSLYVDALVEDFRGFSSVAAVTFRLSGELDFSSLDGGANVRYIDVTPGAPERGSDRGRSFSYTTGRGKYVCQHPLFVRNNPHEPLLSGHTYAVYVTTGVRSAAGDPPAIDPDLQAVLAATRPTGDPALEHAWDAHAPFRDYLASASIEPSTIAAVALFTVQDTTGRAERLAAAVAASAPPSVDDLTLCDDGVTSPCDDGEVRVCGSSDADFYEIHGTFSVPIYQRGTMPYELPADGGDIVEVGGVPQQQGSHDVCFALTIPKGATKPAGGWPLVVYAHGTGGSFKGAVQNGVARTLATAGTPMAVLSYDGVVHGDRRGDSTRDPDSLMFNVINPRAARDNNLQGAVDVWQALRLAAGEALFVDGAGAVDFDASRTYFFGHSQGSNVGVPAVAVTDLTDAAVFSGAGAFLTDGILTKTSPVEAKAGLELLLGEQIGRNHPMMVIWQTYFDDVDTVNYGPLLLRRPPAAVSAKHVLMTWAADDSYSPEATLDTMARSIGLPVAEVQLKDLGTGTAARPISANRSSGDGPRTAACFQYESGDYDGHFVSTRHASSIADWRAFLTSAASAGTPTIP
jgi:predicted esterase